MSNDTKRGKGVIAFIAFAVLIGGWFAATDKIEGWQGKNRQRNPDDKSLTVSIELPSLFRDHYTQQQKDRHDIQVTVTVGGNAVIRGLRIRDSWTEKVSGAPGDEVKVEAKDTYTGDPRLGELLVLTCFILDDKGMPRAQDEDREYVMCRARF